jgi:hypothetical protein
MCPLSPWHSLSSSGERMRWPAQIEDNCEYSNKQSWTTDKEQPSNSRDGRRPTTHHRTGSVLQNFYAGYRSWTNPVTDPTNGKLTYLKLGDFCFCPSLQLWYIFSSTTSNCHLFNLFYWIISVLRSHRHVFQNAIFVNVSIKAWNRLRSSKRIIGRCWLIKVIQWIWMKFFTVLTYKFHVEY